MPQAPTQPHHLRKVKSSNTSLERRVRSAIHRRGFRFRNNVRGLPGTPDIVLARHRAIILVHGCFWHPHGCHLSVAPKSTETFWTDKLRKNIARDVRVKAELEAKGWRVLELRECLLRGRDSITEDAAGMAIESWLLSGAGSTEMPVPDLAKP